MPHFAFTCFYYPLKLQVIFYDDHDIHFDDRALYILRRHHIQSFILKESDSIHDHPNNNDPNTNLNNFYGNARMNWIRKHGTLKFTLPYMNSVLVETWEYFKYHPHQSPRKISRRHNSSPSPHQKYAQPTKISLQVLKCQSERKRMILDV